jgi:hypothetical protein
VNASHNIDDKKRNNLRLALVLASVALTFFAGFIAKMVVFAHH